MTQITTHLSKSDMIVLCSMCALILFALLVDACIWFSEYKERQAKKNYPRRKNHFYDDEY